MFLARRCAVLGFGLMLAAASTEARELEFSVENRISGDNNVFRATNDRTADGFYTFAPRLAVRENNSNLNYEFSYRPSYESYFDTPSIDGFNHLVLGGLDWRPTSTDTIGFNGNFSNRRSLRIEDESAPAAPPALVESDRERLERAYAQLFYSRRLSDTFSVNASATLDNLNYSRDTSVDSRAYSGTLAAQYSMSSITALGLSVTISERQSRPGSFPIDTDTRTWNVGASIERALTPTLSLSVQAGPSFISTEQRSTFAEDESKTTSYFAVMNIKKEWQKADISASYTRFESNGGGSASSSLTDNVSLDFNYRFSRRWALRLYGLWLQSEEIQEAPLPGIRPQKTTQYRVLTSVTRTLSRRLSIVGQFTFFTQDERNRSQSIEGVYSGYLAMRYTFDPILF